MIEFEQTQIGRGLRPLAQRGFVVVDDDGVLSLLGSDRTPIASAPLAQVEASYVRMTRKQTLSVVVAGEKFNVAPGWGAGLGSTRPGAGVKEAAALLLDVIEGRVQP